MKPLFAHQRIGIQKIKERPFFFLADEMGAGKTRQAIEAAQELFLEGTVDQVLILAPAPVRSVWFDPELGQLREYVRVPSTVYEYRAGGRFREWTVEGRGPQLEWLVSNYELVRREEHLERLLAMVGPKTMLVLDESIAVKSPTAAQTKAVFKLRQACGRVLLLNGTPVGDNPGDLYAQAKIMHPDILGCRTWYHFRARYGVMGGFRGKQIVKWTNLEDLNQRLKPYILRRLKTDCLDLPPKLDSVALEVPLSPDTWRLYQDMRRDAVALLKSGEIVTAAQAAVKAMRLSQLTSGYLGGVEEVEGEPAVIREVSNEKTSALLEWLETAPEKVLIWCRFRAEAERMSALLESRHPGRVGLLYGGQAKEARDAAVALLNPKTAPAGHAYVVGTTATGSFGLDLQAAHTVVYLSSDYSLMMRKQSEDRVHRPGQTQPVSYFDMVATGPAGQKTVDHAIIKAVRKKEDVATWTTKDWVSALEEE